MVIISNTFYKCTATLNIISFSTFSNTWENEVGNEISLYLAKLFSSPFLYNGFTTEYFNLEEKIPNDTENYKY
jgi:hypothetical protein